MNSPLPHTYKIEDYDFGQRIWRSSCAATIHDEEINFKTISSPFPLPLQVYPYDTCPSYTCLNASPNKDLLSHYNFVDISQS